jgi:hypothetical protein
MNTTALALSALLFSLNPPPKAAPFGALMLLYRSACSGGCPVYTLTVWQDGQVDFFGEEHVAVQRGTSSLEAVDVQDIRDTLAKINVPSLPEQYPSRKVDLPTTMVCVKVPSEHCVQWRGDSHVPAALSALADRFDRVSKSWLWINGPDAGQAASPTR